MLAPGRWEMQDPVGTAAEWRESGLDARPFRHIPGAAGYRGNGSGRRLRLETRTRDLAAYV